MYIFKIFSLITYHHSRYAESTKNVMPYELQYDLVVIGPYSHYLYPLGYIDHDQEDIEETKRRGKWSLEIYPLDIEDIDHHNM